MDKNTYGDSPAAIKLVEIINECPNSKVITRKVGRLLETFNRRFNAIELIDDRGDIEHLYILMIEDIEDNCLDFLSSDHEQKVKSFLLNIIKGRYKAWKHGERDSIARCEVVENSRIYRTVGGLTTIHRDMEVGTTRFEKRMK